jgi:hypothetical protein
MALGSTQPLMKVSTRNIPGGKGGQCVRLTTSPPSRAECREIWEPKSPGTLWATPGLLWDSFTFTFTNCVPIHQAHSCHYYQKRYQFLNVSGHTCSLVWLAVCVSFVCLLFSQRKLVPYTCRYTIEVGTQFFVSCVWKHYWFLCYAVYLHLVMCSCTHWFS